MSSHSRGPLMFRQSGDVVPDSDAEAIDNRLRAIRAERSIPLARMFPHNTQRSEICTIERNTTMLSAPLPRR